MPSRARRSVDHQYFIRAAPDAVFRALADPDRMTRWLCDRAEVSPRKGGRYLLAWNDGPTHTGSIIEYRRGRRISFAWTWPGVTLQGTVLAFSVRAKDDGTLLRVEHRGFPRLERWTELYGGAEWGWTYFALNLKSVLETGHDLRSRHDG